MIKASARLLAPEAARAAFNADRAARNARKTFRTTRSACNARVAKETLEAAHAARAALETVITDRTQFEEALTTLSYVSKT
jgi:hypothetical protein